MPEPSTDRPVARARVAVLASGAGSNLGALLDHLVASGDGRAADVVLVASDRADAGALARASAAGIDTAALRRPNDARALLELLEEHKVDLVVLAGYLRLVPAEVTQRFHGRMLNVHPALLPAFGGEGMYGPRVHEAVIAAGARVTGATVHFVDARYDHGPIVAQWPVPVFATDFADALARRVLRVEHALLPRVVEAVARGAIRLAPDGTVLGAFSDGPPDAVFALDAQAPTLDAQIARALT